MMTFGLLPTLSVALLGHKYANILFPAKRILGQNSSLGWVKVKKYKTWVAID